MYNKNATAELSRLELAFSQVKAELFDRLHTLIRDDIFDEAPSGRGGRGAGGEGWGEGAGRAGDGGVVSGAEGTAAEGAGGASSGDRSFKDRLTDQVQPTRALSGFRV